MNNSLRMVALTTAIMILAGSAIAKDAKVGDTRVIKLAGHELVFCYVPPGSFTMGNSPDQPKTDQNQRWYTDPVEATLTKGYWLAKTEVTQKVWTAIMTDNPSEHRGETLPVNAVGYNLIQEFINQANKMLDGSATLRLPTEAQWEFAARANENKSTIDNIKEIGWTRADGIKGPKPVATKTANIFGLHDMFGNVCEIVAGFHAPYGKGPQVDPTGAEEGERRITRGGSFTGRVRHANPSDRAPHDPDGALPYNGFRLLLD